MLQDPLFLIAINLFAATLFRMVVPNLCSALLLVVVLIGSTGYLGSQHGDDVLMTGYRSRDKLLTEIGMLPTWPPEKLRTYPNLQLIDQDGKSARLADLRGRVILLQPVGMSSSACVAFSGGQEVGDFHGVVPQPSLDSIEKYARHFAGVSLDQEGILLVQVLFFNQEMKAPQLDELREWVEHFQGAPPSHPRRLVFAGMESQATEEMHRLIPGFQLIDKRFVLRADATGSDPHDNLYTDLLPMIPTLLNE